MPTIPGTTIGPADLAFAIPDDVVTPSVWIDLAVVRANVAAMQARMDAAGIALRPHGKTHKSVRLAQLQVDAGAAGITAATVGEAEVFANGGLRDIFIAYPIWAAGRRGRRIRELHERVAVRIGFDSVEAAEQLAQAVAGLPSLSVVVEVDSGAKRSGVPPAEAGLLAAAAARLGLDPIGAFTYAGHGGSSAVASRAAAADEVRALDEARRSLAAAGFDGMVLSGGSTPTAHLSARAPLTESRPGEYIFQDAAKVGLGVCRPADIGLVVATTVVSKSVPGQVIVDVGHKAIGREGSPELGYGHIPAIPGSRLWRLNEHHGFLSLPRDVSQPRIGEVLALVPNHTCPIVNLFEAYDVLDGGHPVGQWPIDGRGQQA